MSQTLPIQFESSLSSSVSLETNQKPNNTESSYQINNNIYDFQIIIIIIIQLLRIIKIIIK